MKKLLLLFAALTYLQPSNGEEPGRLQSLRDSYERELDRVTTPVTRKYVEALRKLQRNYTTGGDLNAALAVKSEIERVTGSNKAAAALDEEPDFKTWIRSVSLEDPNEKKFTVMETTVVVEPNNGKRFTYKIVEEDEKRRTVVFVFANGVKTSLKVNPNLKTGASIYHGENESELPLEVVPRSANSVDGQ